MIRYSYKSKVVHYNSRIFFFLFMCLTMLNELMSKLRDNLEPVHGNSYWLIAAANDL